MCCGIRPVVRASVSPSKEQSLLFAQLICCRKWVVRLCTGSRLSSSRARKAEGRGLVARGVEAEQGSWSGQLTCAWSPTWTREGNSRFGHSAAGQALEAEASLSANPRGAQPLPLHQAVGLCPPGMQGAARVGLTTHLPIFCTGNIIFFHIIT